MNEDTKGKQRDVDSRPIKVRRVSRMYHGGRRMRFSAVMAVGDHAGKVGLGAGKGADVPMAQDKAASKARKDMVQVVLKGTSIPHEIEFKYKATRVLLRPAAPGTGIVAGATVKAIAELVGIEDLLSKVIGSTNPINTAYATVGALASLRNRVQTEKPKQTKEKVSKTKDVA